MFWDFEPSQLREITIVNYTGQWGSSWVMPPLLWLVVWPMFMLLELSVRKQLTEIGIKLCLFSPIPFHRSTLINSNIHYCMYTNKNKPRSQAIKTRHSSVFFLQHDSFSNYSVISREITVIGYKTMATVSIQYINVSLKLNSGLINTIEVLFAVVRGKSTC